MTGESRASAAPKLDATSAGYLGQWRRDRVAEARAVIADVAHHGDQLIRLACEVLVQHGETAAEREDAQRLLVVIDARRPVRRAQREAQGRAAR